MYLNKNKMAQLPNMKTGRANKKKILFHPTGTKAVTTTLCRLPLHFKTSNADFRLLIQITRGL